MRPGIAALRPTRLPALWVGLWLAMIAAVTVGSLLPAQDIPAPPFAGADKLEHLSGYALLAAYAAMLFARPRGLAIAAVGLVLLGVAIEIAQGTLTASRSADVFDAVANATGVGLGTLLRHSRAAGLLRWLDDCLGRLRER